MKLSLPLQQKRSLQTYLINKPMQKLFYVFAGYVGLGLISFAAITSSLDSSTKIHCSNGIQSACDYLARTK